MKLSQLTIALLIVSATCMNAQDKNHLPKQDSLKKGGKQPLGNDKKTNTLVETKTIKKETDLYKCNKCGKG